MPDAVTNELLFEIMKNVKADVASLRLDVGEIKGGMDTLSARLTSIDQDLPWFTPIWRLCRSGWTTWRRAWMALSPISRLSCHRKCKRLDDFEVAA